jgi:hypothetical protein
MKSLKLGTAGAVTLAVALFLSACSSGPKPEGMDVYPDDSQTYCELNVQKSPAEIPAQTVAILAPTDNFVDFLTLVTRSKRIIGWKLS